jgi:Ca-activated chloride channel homolog
MIWKTLFFICIASLFSFTPFEKESSESRKGGEAYREGDYDKAEEEFSKASKRLENSPQAYYNAGNARKKRGDYEGAIIEYGKALETGASDRMLRSMIFHNMGNSFARIGKFKEAENLYIRSLLENPSEETAENLEIVRRIMEQQEEQEQEENKDQEGSCDQEKEKEKEEGDQQQREQDQKQDQKQEEQGDESEEEHQQEQEQKEQNEEEEERSAGVEETQIEENEEEKVDSSILDQFNQRKNLQISPFMLKREERSESGQTW